VSAETEILTPTPDRVAEVTGTKVVLVDGRPDRRAVMRQMFEHSGLDARVVGEADGAPDALALVEEHNAELVVIDLPSPVKEGMDAVAALRGRFANLAIVVSSFNTDAAVKAQATEMGADAYLVKPVSAREVMAAIPSGPRS
jgi:DNA-binding response OmpR family regulator